MKKFNFDTINPRRGSGSYKWDTFEDNEVIPLWVADMDFKTAPCIIEALAKRVNEGIFGYTFVPDSYYESVINWFSTRHSLRVGKEDMIYTTGVVPAISAIIKAFTQPGDKVIIQTPAYNCFFSSVRNNDCLLAENHLILKDNKFFMDFEDLEEKASDPDAKLLLLCNPHNPTGRTWTREELIRIGEICFRHDVIVVSDEIHCELVYAPNKYIPFASISEEFKFKSVTCTSPSKAFNIAGLQIANIFVNNPEWKQKIDKAININEVCDVNPFGVIALTEAYTHGEEWLEAVKDYIYKNYLYLRDRIEIELPDFKLADLEGTYLAWLDCGVLDYESEEIVEYLLHNYKVLLNSGKMYHDKSDSFIRINLATSRIILEKGTDRLISGLKQLKTLK